MTEVIRNLRHMLIQHDRATLREGDSDFALRRSVRTWRRQLLELPAFLRIAATTVDEMNLYIICNKVFALRFYPPTPAQRTKAFVEAANTARAEVEIAARVIRRCAAEAVDENEKIILNNAAVFIEFLPSYSSGDRQHDFYDWRNMGQGLSRRAFVIREVAAMVSATVPSRYATIAELVRFIGYDASPQLVRATLRKGHT